MSLLNCGVTVVKPVRNEKKLKTENEFVMHSPILEPSGTVSIDFAENQGGHLNPFTKK